MEDNNNNYHVPVLLKESIEGLNIKPDGVYVDLTYGGGGHSQEILNQLGEDGVLIAFDQDSDAQENLIEDKRLKFIAQNFQYLKRFLKLSGYKFVDGILGDLGISSWQINTATRGFSTRFSGPLDMRMNINSELDATQVINDYPEKELDRIFYEYGDLRQSKKLAKAIVEHRRNSRIKTIDDLKNVTAAFIGAFEHKMYARIFQAIRIEVNQEMEVLKEVLKQSSEVLKPGGRLSVISYHSLEDRLVKNFIKSGQFDGVPIKDFYGNVEKSFKAVNKKIIIPSKEELKKNKRSRSAKLRIAEKL